MAEASVASSSLALTGENAKIRLPRFSVPEVCFNFARASPATP